MWGGRMEEAVEWMEERSISDAPDRETAGLGERKRPAVLARGSRWSCSGAAPAWGLFSLLFWPTDRIWERLRNRSTLFGLVADPLSCLLDFSFALPLRPRW